MQAIAWKNILSFVTDANPRLIIGVNVVLVLMLSYTLAQMTWRAVPAPEPLPAPPPVKVASTKQSSATNQSASLARQLPQWHLFGRADVAKAAPKQEVIPETKLKLTLRGLFASDDQAESWAIIADSSKKENFYKVGSSLPGNAKLEEIHADRIVLVRRGKYETLRLPKESLDLASAQAPASRSGSRVNRRTQSTSNMSLKEYRDTLLNNPQKVTDLVNIAPVRKRGKFVGYSLQPGRDAEFMSRYGLQPGDIVTSINGVVLDSPAKGLGVLRDLASADTLNIEIERNGRREHFSLPVN